MQINKIRLQQDDIYISPHSSATFTGTSNDTQNPSEYSNVSVLSSTETIASIFTKISYAFRNIR